MNKLNKPSSRVDRPQEHQSIPVEANFNDPMDFDPTFPDIQTFDLDMTLKQRNSMRRNQSKSFAHLPPSPATQTNTTITSPTLRRPTNSETPQRSPGFVRALNSQRNDQRSTPTRPKSSHSRPGTPPPKSFLSDDHKRRNRLSVGSRFAAEAKQFFSPKADQPGLNSRRKSTPAINTASISSTSIESPSTCRDSTSFSSLRSRRNSASSDISSIQSNDEFGLPKDIDVPPVPRIPKDYSETNTIPLTGSNNDNNANGLRSQASAYSETTATTPQKVTRKKYSESSFTPPRHRFESRDSNYSPTQANCINFPQSSKRSSTVRRITPSSIPFFRRSASAQNMNDNLKSDDPPPPVPPISQSHIAQNSVSSAGTIGTTSSTGSSTPHRKSMLGIGLPSLLKTSSSRKSLSTSKPVSTENLSDKPKQNGEQSTFRQRRNSLSAVIMGRRRGKTVGSQSTTSHPEPVPKIKPEFLENNDKEKDRSSTPVSTPVVRTRTIRASDQQKEKDSNDATITRTTNSFRTMPQSSSLQKSSSHSSHETLNPDNKRDQKLITPTRIPRISMSAVRTPQTRSPGSIRRRPSVNDTTRKVSDNSINTINTVNSTKSSRLSTNGSMNNLNDALSSDSTIEMRKRVVDKSLENQSKRLSKIGIDNKDDKVDRNNTISLVKSTPRASSIYTTNKQSTSIPTSMSSTSIGSRHSIHATPKVRSLATPVSSRSTTNLNGQTPITAKVRTPRQNQDEVIADEEMMAYIRRSQARRLAAGAKLSELESMLAFPEPVMPTTRMSPREAIALFGSSLSPYEQNEIFNHRDIYFVGQSSKKKLATKERSSSNYGYDDERGDYHIIKHDHLNYRYEIMDTLGKGSFGQVLECLDHKTGHSVAIKIIRNKKRFHHQALVEVKILDRLVDWDPENKHNVIMKTEHFYFRGHLCIATELLSINLYELIKANCFAGFTTALIKRFAAQMLQSLVLMKHHNVIHCDLKPENVLLRHPAKSSIKVIDFGSSCFENEKVYTYIQSRFYRSPEVILGMEYTAAIDMWSFGAILVELYTGYPIFPGENEQEQLACLMEILGIPEKYIIDKSSRRKIFFDSTGAPRPVINSKGRRRRPNSKSIASVLKTDDEQFVDFITRCLTWDPEKRLKPSGALRHPFVTGLPPPPKTTTTKTVRRPSTAQPSSGSTTFKIPNGTAGESKKSMISNPTPLNRHRVSHSHSQSNASSLPGQQSVKSPKIPSLSNTPRILRSKLSSTSTSAPSQSSKVSTISATSKY
ncbi:kinase-like protein [Wallemia mellicola]|nr:kinase-like protein [Wallemia mellicola]